MLSAKSPESAFDESRWESSEIPLVNSKRNDHCVLIQKSFLLMSAVPLNLNTVNCKHIRRDANLKLVLL